MRRFIALTVLVSFLSGGLVAQDQKAELTKLRAEARELFEAKKWPEAEKVLAEILKIDGKNGTTWSNYGYALHSQNKLDEALKAHEKAAEFGKPREKATATYNIACVYALKKDSNKAFEYLEKAVAAGFNNVDQIEGDSDLTSLHEDPRYKKLLAAAAEAGKNAGGGDEVMLFNQSSDRKSTRAAMFSNTGGKGEIHVSWGPVEWKDEYEAHIKSEKVTGKRWRLGADFWTTLDTNLPMTFGKTTVAPGYYYLTVEKRADGQFVLNILDPVEVRKSMLDAFQSGVTKGGMEVTLTHDAGEVAKSLTMSMAIDESDKTKGTYTVRFGAHKLSAAFTTSAPAKQ